MVGILSLAAFGVAIIALINEVISVSLEYWVYIKQNGIENYSGLWKSCVEGPSNKVCSSDGATDELRAVQAMVLLGLFCNFAAVICAALKLFFMKEQKLLSYAVTGLLVAAGLFMMIGFAVYAGELYVPLFKPAGYDLHAGFAFCIISWIAAWVAAALFGLVVMKEK